MLVNKLLAVQVVAYLGLGIVCFIKNYIQGHSKREGIIDPLFLPPTPHLTTQCHFGDLPVNFPVYAISASDIPAKSSISNLSAWT